MKKLSTEHRTRAAAAAIKTYCDGSKCCQKMTKTNKQTKSNHHRHHHHSSHTYVPNPNYTHSFIHTSLLTKLQWSETDINVHIKDTNKSTCRKSHISITPRWRKRKRVRDHLHFRSVIIKIQFETLLFGSVLFFGIFFPPPTNYRIHRTCSELSDSNPFFWYFSFPFRVKFSKLKKTNSKVEKNIP